MARRISQLAVRTLPGVTLRTSFTGRHSGDFTLLFRCVAERSARSNSTVAQSFLATYHQHEKERSALGIPPKPLDAFQVAEITSLLDQSSILPEEGRQLLELITHRVPPGVDEAAYVKAAWLTSCLTSMPQNRFVTQELAVKLLGTMQGGYNIAPLIKALDDPQLAPRAVTELSHTILVFDAFYDVQAKAEQGNEFATQVLNSWSEAEWFTSRDPLQHKLTLTVFRVTGETNTDDLSPAQDAWSRPDIPLHALAMLKNERGGVTNAMQQLQELKEKGFPLVYVGDVVGTGSSRKSATNSLLWHMGVDIPFVPNKRSGGVTIGAKIAPIFFNTMEDSGSLPLEMCIDNLNMGDIIDIYPYDGIVKRHNTEEVLANFILRNPVLLDEWRAGGRIPLIIGRGLTERARKYFGLPPSDIFTKPSQGKNLGKQAFTYAQKIVAKACGLTGGILPGTYCEPKVTTVGSQDTTGPMTRDELKDLACLGFSADLVLQSFCHTAAYPKPVDISTHHSLPDFVRTRGGVSLKPGDGVIHSWLNRMLLPDTVGTGGDSHTRFPLGISFPAGSGLVAFGAATGVIPLDMPESVLVKFSGSLQPGITLRDLVHAIPYFAIQEGLLTVSKENKLNVFSGRILEIEGVEHLKCEQAFELSDASAERSAAGCTIKLDKEPIQEYLESNIVLLQWMIAQGYGDKRAIERRIEGMKAWLAVPSLLEADADADYTARLYINLDDITEPILCAPNDPDDARLLSDVAGDKVDEVFIGSCMTNIGHFRAAGRILEKFHGTLPTRLWIAPPTKMDESSLKDEGFYGTFGAVGARTEMPGCSLCMGNQARVAERSTVVSTSTRNFPNRLGKGANVYLASAELAAVCAILGRIPTTSEYMAHVSQLAENKADTYRYLNFNQLSQYVTVVQEQQ